MSSYKSIPIIGVIFFSVISHAAAQTDSIDLFIIKEMQARKIPGLQLAIVKDSKVIKSASYGWANLQDSIPVKPTTLFTINSITKAFTGVAIMQLVETGKLSLSSPISNYVPALPAAWNKVTILQLLSHTSGIPDIVDEEESILISPYGEAAAWKQVQALPMDFDPGEKFSYNQTNYLLLGKVIDSLSRMPFTEFITNEQLLKAGMPNTARAGFGATKTVIRNAAAGYRLTRGQLINMFFAFPPSLQTAAGMSSTADEMARWLVALQKGLLLKEKKSLEILWTPAVLKNGNTAGFGGALNGYAVGWPVIKRPLHPAVAAVGGGRSAVFVYPNDNVSIVVLTNLAGSAPETFIDELAAFFIPGLKK